MRCAFAFCLFIHDFQGDPRRGSEAVQKRRMDGEPGPAGRTARALPVPCPRHSVECSVAALRCARRGSRLPLARREREVAYF